MPRETCQGEGQLKKMGQNSSNGCQIYEGNDKREEQPRKKAGGQQKDIQGLASGSAAG